MDQLESYVNKNKADDTTDFKDIDFINAKSLQIANLRRDERYVVMVYRFVKKSWKYLSCYILGLFTMWLVYTL